jgi:hypothetical protein
MVYRRVIKQGCLMRSRHLVGIIGAVCLSLLLTSIRSHADTATLPPFPNGVGQATLFFPNTSEFGMLDATTHTKRYMLLAPDQSNLTVIMRHLSGDLVPKLSLYDASATLLTEQQADLAGRTATLKFTAATRAWYFVDVNVDQAGEVGDYSLTLQGGDATLYTLLPMGAPPNSTDSTMQTVIHATYMATGDRRTDVSIQFPMYAQQTISIAIRAATSSGTLTLDPSNPTQPATLAFKSDGSLTYTGTANGWLHLTIHFAAVGNAQLSVSNVTTPPANVTLVPQSVLDAITLTPTLTFTPSSTVTLTRTPTLTFTPSKTWTPSPSPTITPLPSATPFPSDTPTKTVITSLHVTLPDSVDQVVATDTVWVMFGGSRSLPKPGHLILNSPPFYNNPYMLRFSWCAADPATEAAILQPFDLKFYVDNTQVDPSDILVFDRQRQSDQEYCRYWATLLSYWPNGGTVNLKIVYTLSKPVFDGTKTIPDGMYILELIMHVKYTG